MIHRYYDLTPCFVVWLDSSTRRHPLPRRTQHSDSAIAPYGAGIYQVAELTTCCASSTSCAAYCGALYLQSIERCGHILHSASRRKEAGPRTSSPSSAASEDEHNLRISSKSSDGLR